MIIQSMPYPRSLLSGDYFEDVMLQMVADEGNGATSGTEKSLNAYAWTRTGNAVVSGGYYTFDGTGDYITLASDTGDWNFLHNGSSWTMEAHLAARPTNAANVIFDTNGTATASVGAACWITSSGNVRLLVTRGVSGQPLIDYTSSFTVPVGGGVIVIDYNGRANDGGGQVRIGLNGVRQEVANRSNTYDYVADDASYDFTIGASAAGAGNYYNGALKLRIWRNRQIYGLSVNSTYSTLPYGAIATGGIKTNIQPRFVPYAETAAAGRTWGVYLSEPRLIDLGGGEYEMWMTHGSGHAPATGTVIARMLSHNYGLQWDDPVDVISDGTYSCRNIATGVDENGVRIVCYRTFNGTSTVGIYYRTSADNFSTATDITAKLVSNSVPWGEAVITSNGLTFTFYTANVGQTLVWNAGTLTFGTAKTIYDRTLSAPGYNEPFALSDGAENVVWVSRRDGAGNNRFVITTSNNGGLTFDDPAEIAWTGTTFERATPIGGCVAGDKVYICFVTRNPYAMRTITIDRVAFFTDPTRAFDGRETIATDAVEARTFAGTEFPANYGYPSVMAQAEGWVIRTWYEQKVASVEEASRIWVQNVDIGYGAAPDAPTYVTNNLVTDTGDNLVTDTGDNLISYRGA